MERTRDLLWYDYLAEVATPEGYQENPISFKEEKKMTDKYKMFKNFMFNELGINNEE